MSQGWAKASYDVMRFSGSTTKSCSKKLTISGNVLLSLYACNCSQKLKLSESMSIGYSGLKGGSPVLMKNMTQPSDQESILKSVYY